jgi:hypothetical protein
MTDLSGVKTQPSPAPAPAAKPGSPPASEAFVVVVALAVVVVISVVIVWMLHQQSDEIANLRSQVGFSQVTDTPVDPEICRVMGANAYATGRGKQMSQLLSKTTTLTDCVTQAKRGAGRAVRASPANDPAPHRRRSDVWTRVRTAVA